MNDTILNYVGLVDIKLKINGKIYEIYRHNAGEEALFVLFAKILYGEYTQYDIPGAIDVERKKEEEEYYTSFTKKLITDITKQLVDNEKSVSFLVKIDYDNLLELVDDTTEDVFRFALYSKGNTAEGVARKLLATIPVRAEELKYITPGTSAILTWTLRVVNYLE